MAGCKKSAAKKRKGRIFERRSTSRTSKRWKAYAADGDEEDHHNEGDSGYVDGGEEENFSLAEDLTWASSLEVVVEPGASAILLFIRNHLYFGVALPGTLQCWWLHVATLSIHVELIIILFVLFVKAANPTSPVLVILLGIGAAVAVTLLRPSTYKRFHLHDDQPSCEGRTTSDAGFLDAERRGGSSIPKPSSSFLDMDIDAVDLDWRQEAVRELHQEKSLFVFTDKLQSRTEEKIAPTFDPSFLQRRNTAIMAFAAAENNDSVLEPTGTLKPQTRDFSLDDDDVAMDDIPSIATVSEADRKFASQHQHHVEDFAGDEDHDDFGAAFKPVPGSGRPALAFPTPKFQESMAEYAAEDDDENDECQPIASSASVIRDRSMSKFFAFGHEDDEEQPLPAPSSGPNYLPFVKSMMKEAPPVISESGDGDPVDDAATLFSPSAGGDTEFDPDRGQRRPGTNGSWTVGSPRSVDSFILKDLPPLSAGSSSALPARGRGASVARDDVVVEDIECLTIWSPRGLESSQRPRSIEQAGKRRQREERASIADDGGVGEGHAGLWGVTRIPVKTESGEVDEFAARGAHDSDIHPSLASSSSSTPRTPTEDDRIVVRATTASAEETKKERLPGDAEIFDFEIDVDGLIGGSPSRQPKTVELVSQDSEPTMANARHLELHSDAQSVVSSNSSLESISARERGMTASQQQQNAKYKKHWAFAVAVALFVVIFFIAALFPNAVCSVTQAPNVPLLIVLIVDCALIQAVATSLRRHI